MSTSKKGRAEGKANQKKGKQRGKAMTLNFDLRCRVTTDLLDDMMEVVAAEGGTETTLFGALNMTRAYVESVRSPGTTSDVPDDPPESS